MEISTLDNVATITGNIKTVNDFQEIKQSLDALSARQKNITINITESLSITSSVIGYFNKLVLKDQIVIEMNIGNKQLLELFDELNLSAIFKVNEVLDDN